MAEITQQGSHNRGRRKAKKHSTRIDMTPMVDLAFLLLTFFILTVTFNQTGSMVLTFPPPGEPSELKKGITFLLGDKDRIFYYEGEFRPQANEKGPKTELAELSFSPQEKLNLHAFLLEKNKSMQSRIKTLNHRHKGHELPDSTFKRLVRECKASESAYTFLIKADNKASYKNVIDVIDELNINVVGKYWVADLMAPEQELLSRALRENN